MYMAKAKILGWGSIKPIFHWLLLGYCDGGNANFSVFEYQHVGIPNAKFRVGGLSQRQGPKQVFLGGSGI